MISTGFTRQEAKIDDGIDLTKWSDSNDLFQLCSVLSDRESCSYHLQAKAFLLLLNTFPEGNYWVRGQEQRSGCCYVLPCYFSEVL